MSNTLFTPIVGNLQQVLSLRLQQHGLGASNLANANTPGFEAKRVDFEKALGQVFSQGGVQMKRTQAGHTGAAGRDGSAPIKSIEAHPMAQDGNSVNAEQEMMLLTANNLQFNATVEVLSRQLAMLEYAASDGGR